MLSTCGLNDLLVEISIPSTLLKATAHFSFTFYVLVYVGSWTAVKLATQASWSGRRDAGTWCSVSVD